MFNHKEFFRLTHIAAALAGALCIINPANAQVPAAKPTSEKPVSPVVPPQVMPKPLVLPAELQPMRVSIEGLKPNEQAVVLRAVDIKTEIVGHTAQTTVDFTFYNPNNRVLEGQLQFPLLDGQSVTGFALEMVDGDMRGKMREAVPVEKGKGQEVFEDVTRQRVDPALLHVTQGNNYQVRLYPLNPQQTRRVQLRYIEALNGNTNGSVRYRLPLFFGSKLQNLNVAVNVAGAGRAPVAQPAPVGTLEFKRVGDHFEAKLNKQNVMAQGRIDISIPTAGSAQTRTQMLDGKNYFYAEVPQSILGNAAAMAPRKLPTIIGLLWDDSLSGAERDHNRELALLDAYFARIGNAKVKLRRIHDAVTSEENFTILNGDWQELRRTLEATVYDGATNLGAVSVDRSVDEYLLFSDGLNNYGDQNLAPMQVPLYTVMASAKSDPVRLRYLAERSGGQLIDLVADKPEDALNKLLNTPARLIRMESNGASDLVSPSILASGGISGGTFALAGVLTEASTIIKLTFLMPDGKQKTIEVPIRPTSEQSELVATLWARLRVTQLEGNYDVNRGEIRRLGKTFGLATRETSLIVLDRVEDYVRYDIVPPQELRAAFDQLRVKADRDKDADKQAHFYKVLDQWNERLAWWKRDFPKDNGLVARPQNQALNIAQNRVRELDSRRADMVMAPPAPAAAAPAPMMDMQADEKIAVSSASKSKDIGSSDASSAPSIKLKQWTPDAPYIKRLNAATPDTLYQIYLDERPSYANSTAFYLDVSDKLFEKGMNEQALRVLSNLAEMDLGNRQILRILGYRLLQAKQAKAAIDAFKKVLEMAPEEPQSYRDLALAYAADGQNQLAIDLLYQVVDKPWNQRFPGIELIALTELNAILTNSKTALNTQRMDQRLLTSTPLDMRVVLTWDTDMTDIDLWVTDPNGERAFYGNPLTYQGGRMSPDATQGYGPEEFSLRKAKPGKYKVEINFFGERQQLVTGATTIQVNFFTGYGTLAQKDQLVTLRLKKPGEGIYVGEFEMK